MTREEAISILKTFRITGDKAHEAFDMAIKALEKQPCKNCISREAAIDIVEKWFNKIQLNGDICCDGIRSLPSVEPERKLGKWEWNKRTGEYECSKCGCNPVYEGMTPDESEIDKYRFCRWCGSKMEVEEWRKA